MLGPLEVVAAGRQLPLGGTKQRAVLAQLLLAAGRTVSVDRLVAGLWGNAPPESAAKMIQIHVSKLRKVLPGELLQTRAPGYEFTVPDGSLDLDRFERLCREGRAAAAEGRHADAARRLDEALSLWRGVPLAEFGAEPFAAAESARLEELRTAAREDRVDADLALGRHGDVVAELELAVAQHPLRERLRGQLILALYRSGRQAEALASYRAFRGRLSDDLGIEPSAALKELERRMLRQDPALDAARPEAAPATSRPEIRHARSGDVSIAYQVVGDGPLDIVLVHGWVCTFEPGWEDPVIARFYRRLASLGRLILFDKRGTGLSDRISGDAVPDLETRMDDVRAVMDAAGSQRAVLIGISEGGPMSMLFAAMHPARVAGLVLLGTFPRLMWAPDYPIGQPEAVLRRRLVVIDDDDWATATTHEWLGRVAPAVLADAGRLAWYRSYVMRGASPASARTIRLMNAEIDVRHVLPAISVPTLVACREGEAYAPASRYLAARIRGARLAELPGQEHLPWEGDQDALLDGVEHFLAGIHEEAVRDRVLVTLLVTDVVGRTATAAGLGDRAWRDLLERHYAVVRAQLARHRGREVDRAGDGVLAVFDGPARAVRCAAAIVDAVRPLGLDLRAGVHTGEVEYAGENVRGIAVRIASRVTGEARPGEVLVSRTVKDLVAGSGLDFEKRGVYALAGVPGEWELLALSAGRLPGDRATRTTAPAAKKLPSVSPSAE